MASIPQSGACVVSRNVWERRGRVKWMVRETSRVPVDNGWRIYSEIDDDAYLADAANMAVVAYDDVCAIEPLLVAIYDFPVGSDLQIVDEGDGARIVRTDTGEEIPEEVYYRPPTGG